MKKTYVITGATSGIGEALVKRLIKEGNVVFAGYRNNKFSDKLEAIGTIPFYIDMEYPASIADAANFIKSKIDKVDTLVNVAGCVVAGVIEEISADKIKNQFEVNTFGHLDFTQRLLSLLKSGRIINISSMASFGIFPFVAPYCASKRALDILFNALTLESDIKVVSVKPGVIATPLWDKSIDYNRDTIEKCKNHEKEMKYMIANARNNGQNGLNVEKVVDFVLKIDKIKNPKPSYTVGADAKFAEIISRLPFDVQNKIIKFGMKRKFNTSKL